METIFSILIHRLVQNHAFDLVHNTNLDFDIYCLVQNIFKILSSALHRKYKLNQGNFLMGIDNKTVIIFTETVAHGIPTNLYHIHIMPHPNSCQYPLINYIGLHTA